MLPTLLMFHFSTFLPAELLKVKFALYTGDKILNLSLSIFVRPSSRERERERERESGVVD